MFRKALMTVLISGAALTAPVLAQAQNAGDPTKMVLDRVTQIDPITSAIIQDGVLYAAVRGKSGGQNGLAARVCRIASSQDPNVNKVRVVDWNTTRAGRSAQEWRVLGYADC